jgi:hypothetical protein
MTSQSRPPSAASPEITISEPTETTSLLQNSDTNGNGTTKSNGVVIDPERGGGDEGEDGEEVEVNPLHEGNAEMVKKMHLLFPAVCIGVSSNI